MRLLLALTETSAAAKIGRTAEAEGWKAQAVGRPAELLRAAAGAPSGAVVADWRALGGGADAKGFLARLRAAAPGYLVVFLGTEGLAEALGWADDFLPAAPSDAALREALRRLKIRLGGHAGEAGVLSAAGLKADRRRHKAYAAAGSGSWKEVGRLTAKEFELLCLLLERPGAPIERAAILDRLWHASSQVNFETIDKHVASLRRKLGKRGTAIRSVRGRGYVLAEK